MAKVDVTTGHSRLHWVSSSTTKPMIRWVHSRHFVCLSDVYPCFNEGHTLRCDVWLLCQAVHWPEVCWREWCSTTSILRQPWCSADTSHRSKTSVPESPATMLAHSLIRRRIMILAMKATKRLHRVHSLHHKQSTYPKDGIQAGASLDWSIYCCWVPQRRTCQAKKRPGAK